MIGIPNPTISSTATYDAWNRLIGVTDASTSITNDYDARGFRITETTGGVVRHYYYTPGWQCVEERTGTLTSPERQFVWGMRYIDDLVIRDRSTANNGSINERRYAMQDGNWNTVAICDITGTVGERYAYSAYGTPVFMTGAGTVQSSSPIGFETLYAGYRWDNASPQMYYVRNRFLLPQVGTWNKRDPLGYVDGLWLYRLIAPLRTVDPFGLKVHESPPSTTGYGPAGDVNSTFDVFLGYLAAEGKNKKYVSMWAEALRSAGGKDCFTITPLWITNTGNSDNDLYPPSEFALDALNRAKKSAEAGRCSVFLYIGHTTLASPGDLDNFRDFVGLLPENSFLGLSGCVSAKYIDEIPKQKQLSGCPLFKTAINLPQLNAALNDEFSPKLTEQLRDLCRKCGCSNDSQDGPGKTLDVFLYFGDFTWNKEARLMPKLNGPDLTRKYGFGAWPNLVPEVVIKEK